MAKIKKKTVTKAKIKRVSQSDVPAYSLEHALRVPTAIADNYASEPSRPLGSCRSYEYGPYFKPI